MIVRATKRDRVAALIRSEPGLTDTEIGRRTGIEPHQQVNQICRSLETAGLTRRIPGSAGRIINVPLPQSPDAGQIRQRQTPSHEEEHPPAPTATPTAALYLLDSLIVVPCSGAKRRGNTARSETSVLDGLPLDLAGELSARRLLNAERSGLDETTLLPAADRYEGTFYRSGGSAIKRLADQGARVLISSGAYGLVMADESIGMYEQAFRPGMWPNRLVERCLAEFAEGSGVRQVIGVLSATTGYSKVFRHTRWPRHVDGVFLASPESTTGAMVKAPRAQGEWLATLAGTGRIPASWSSSDGLRMGITRL